MARPNKKTVEYFPHQCTHKQTMYIIDRQYGNNGFAFWFKLLELTGSTPGHFIDCQSLATWNYLLSYTHFNHNSGMQILNLLAELDAIDRELWQKKNIIWIQNFVDGIADVYRRRKMEIPQKPGLNGALPFEGLLQQKIDNNGGIAGDNVDNNGGIAGDNSTETPQSKLNKSKDPYTTYKGGYPPSNSNNFSYYKKQLNEAKNKTAVLAEAYKTWHTDAPEEDFKHDFLYGYLGKMTKRLNNDYGYLLKIIWETAADSIAGSRLNYINAKITTIIKKKKDAKPKTISETDFKDPDKIDEELLQRQTAKGA